MADLKDGQGGDSEGAALRDLKSRGCWRHRTGTASSEPAWAPPALKDHRRMAPRWSRCVASWRALESQLAQA